ncbi:MAG: hypothetical protein PHV24_05160 [Candidatus Kapabacteria bacterium]|nr:hypothetical protein [Candidatus Kapabacteria bacterium]
MEKIQIGTISAVKGLDGSVILSDVPRNLVIPEGGVAVYIGYSANFAKKFTLAKWVKLPNHAMLRLDEITSPEAALEYKEQGVFVEKSVLKKQKARFVGEFLGYEALDAATGKSIGKITDVWEFPASDIWIISGDGTDYTVPAVEEFISDLDDDSRTFRVKIIDGMRDLNKEE